jgi:predicted nucleic acid-binding protein
VIILDTNVISEIMRGSIDPKVSAWLGTQPLSTLATTAINLAELRYGLARLAFGRRRRDLESRLSAFAARAFVNRVFDFDAAASDAYGDLMVAGERSGRRFDGLIAAIAKSRALPIVTRDTADFENCGVRVISPWTDPPVPV